MVSPFEAGVIGSFVEVCDRTQEVRDRILSLVGESLCEDVGAAVLENITTMTIALGDRLVLLEGDFSGLTNLRRLDLIGNALNRLTSDIFDGLDNLQELYLWDNGLSEADCDTLRNSLPGVLVSCEASLIIVTPSYGTVFNLTRGDGTSATTQVAVVVAAVHIEVPVAMAVNVQLGSSGALVASVSTSSIILAIPEDGITRRMAEFAVDAIEEGITTVTITVSNGLGSEDEVKVRVVVEQVGECKSCLIPDMVAVSTATFMMGSPSGEADRVNNEGPQHLVTISEPFAVGRFEVTRGQFRAFVDARRYDAGNNWRSPRSPRTFMQTDTHPVVGVSWRDAKAYLRWLTTRTGQRYRLLSEAEWEYVTRAGTTTRYHFGDAISPSDANYVHSEKNGTVEVGLYSANAFGLYDVHGNVLEWVEDCWHSNYEGAPVDGSAWVDGCRRLRVVRGGYWYAIPVFLRSAFRAGLPNDNRSTFSGFRIARELKP